MAVDRGRPSDNRFAHQLERTLSDERARDWMDEHLTELRRSVSEPRILHWSLAVGFVVGLAAHIGGYAPGLSATTEPLGLVADLLYALGWSLWTGVVVVVFTHIIPETKRRQIKQVVDAYEAAQRDEARNAGDQASGDDEVPTANQWPRSQHAAASPSAGGRRPCLSRCRDRAPSSARNRPAQRSRVAAEPRTTTVGEPSSRRSRRPRSTWRR